MLCAFRFYCINVPLKDGMDDESYMVRLNMLPGYSSALPLLRFQVKYKATFVKHHLQD